ncbi:MAG: hypothetical protein COA94_08785 [Rickettsiales bacterium]|nr:MAG: hypothetical protein COA94_08785 [Rickettsiales bacterium]
MKNSEVKEDFKSPYMARVAKRLRVLRMTDEERIEYHKYLKESAVQEDILHAATERGREEGVEEGIEKGREEGLSEGAKLAKIEVVKTMLMQGLDVNLISQATKLSIDEVKALRSHKVT